MDVDCGERFGAGNEVAETILRGDEAMSEGQLLSEAHLVEERQVELRGKISAAGSTVLSVIGEEDELVAEFENLEAWDHAADSEEPAPALTCWAEGDESRFGRRWSLLRRGALRIDLSGWRRDRALLGLLVDGEVLEGVDELEGIVEDGVALCAHEFRSLLGHGGVASESPLADVVVEVAEDVGYGLCGRSEGKGPEPVAN